MYFLNAMFVFRGICNSGVHCESFTREINSQFSDSGLSGLLEVSRASDNTRGVKYLRPNYLAIKNFEYTCRELHRTWRINLLIPEPRLCYTNMAHYPWKKQKRKNNRLFKICIISYELKHDSKRAIMRIGAEEAATSWIYIYISRGSKDGELFISRNEKSRRNRPSPRNAILSIMLKTPCTRGQFSSGDFSEGQATWAVARIGQRGFINSGRIGTLNTDEMFEDFRETWKRAERIFYLKGSANGRFHRQRNFG